MKKTYRTISFGTHIDIVDVVRETNSTIWIKRKDNNTEQYRKKSDSFRFFDTIHEAKKYLIGRYTDEIEYHTKLIERANEAIKKVQAIDPAILG